VQGTSLSLAENQGHIRNEGVGIGVGDGVGAAELGVDDLGKYQLQSTKANSLTKR
jgi:hypothetical protein